MKHSTRCLMLALLALGGHTRARAQAVGQPGSAPGTPESQTGYVDLLAGLAYTDNAQLARGQRSGDGIGTAGIDADYARQGKLSLNLLGNVERVEYLRGTFGGSFYGHFNGSAILGKPTDPLQWTFRDSFGEGSTDPLSAPSPANLQTINNLATGPIVNLHVGLANRLTFFGLYSRTSYQRSPFDSQSYQGGAEFSHRLSGASSLSLQASTERTRYIERSAVASYLGGTVPDYDIRQASVSYQTDLARARILLRAGYNILDYGAGVRHGSPLYEVRISRGVSPYSTVFVSGHAAYSTNGTSMASPDRQITLQAGGVVNPGFAVAQPYLERSGALGWSFQRARTHFSLVGTIRQAVFEQTIGPNSYNHRGEDVVATLGRQLRPTMAVDLRVQADEERYSDLSARSRWESVRLTLSKHLARMAIWLYAERRHQSGTPGASTFTAASYDDNRIGLNFTYDLFGARSVESAQGAMPGMAGSAAGY